ncbi:MAG: LLM class flavin-dependent oxidoreductase [Acidimicrobiales bacterium]
MIRISIQGHASDGAGWLNLARTADAFGFDTLYAADHPGALPAPFVWLAAATAVTKHIKLGTCVLNSGLWEPYSLATAVATLDIISGGRALFGVGAGHTPSEWEMRGIPIPSPLHRIDRMAEVVAAVQSLLSGETVTIDSKFIKLDAARLSPMLNRTVPLMVGGGGEKVLRFAAATAGIVGVTGLGKTLSDGHRHEANWTEPALDQMFEIIRSVVPSSGQLPDVEALVQHIEITEDPKAAATTLAEAIPNATPDDLLGAPFIWIGSGESIAERLLEHEQRWGINRYVVRARVLAQALEVMKHL